MNEAEESTRRFGIIFLFVVVTFVGSIFLIYMSLNPTDPRSLEGWDPTKVVGSPWAIEVINSATRVNVSTLEVVGGNPFDGRSLSDYQIVHGPVVLDSDLADQFLGSLKRVANQLQKYNVLLGCAPAAELLIEIEGASSSIQLYVDFDHQLLEIYEKGYLVGQLRQGKKASDGGAIEGDQELFARLWKIYSTIPSKAPDESKSAKDEQYQEHSSDPEFLDPDC